MPIKKGSKREYFPRVREAREYLLDKAVELMELHHKLIIQAAEAGEYEAALKATEWAIDHTPADEDGVRMIEGSIDKVKEDRNKYLPTIQIGLKIGGMPEPKALPEPVIDVQSEEVNE
jgi:hypothetical protein